MCQHAGMAVAGVDGNTREVSRVQVWAEAARPFVGVLVIGLWIVWAVVAWRVEPRSVDAEQLRSDIASGRVLTYRVTGEAHSSNAWLPSATGDGWDTLGLDVATGLPNQDPSQAPATGVVYWVDAPFAQTRFFDANNVNSSLAADHAPASYEGLVRELRAAGVPLESRGLDRLPNQSAAFLWGWAAILLGFGSVLLVYRPTRVTRWGWLWLVYLLPFGLGLVALAVNELVRPAPPAPPQLDDDGEPREPRIRGGRALLVGLALGLLVSVVAGEVSQSIDSLWVP